jgi:hypothetical protein
MWIIPLIAIIPIIYFLAKKSPDNSFKGYEDKDRGVKSPPPLSPSIQSEDKKFIPAPAVVRDDFKYDKKIKLFLYCHKTGLLQNLDIFEMLCSYMSISENYDIKIKDMKFIPAPALVKDNDLFKYNSNDFLNLSANEQNKLYESYFSKLNNKFRSVGIYRDKKERDFIINYFVEYLNNRVEIIPNDIKTDKQINFIITDNIGLAYLQYVNNFKKVKINIDYIISNNKNILDYAPDNLKKLNYRFIKFKKKKDLLESIPIVGDLVSKIEDIIPDDLKKIANELKAPFFVSSIFGNTAGIIVYIGQKINKDKFNSLCENLYGFCGAVVSAIFLTPVAFPLGYKITKTQARFVLEGKIDTKDLNVETKIIKDKIKQIANDYKTDVNYDAISLTDTNINT